LAVEIREKIGIGEVSEARGGVGHDIGDPGDKGYFGAVTVVPLVLTGALTEVGSRAVRGGGPLVHARDSGGIVAACSEGAVADVEVLADNVEVDEGGKLLEVAIGDGAVAVGTGHQGFLDVGRKRGAPHTGALAAGEEDAAHAVATSVCGPEHRVGVRNDFGQASGAVFEREHEVAEAGEVGAQMASQADATRSGALEWQLQDGEQATGPRDARGDKAEFTE